ncbi:MAG: Rrf2 family transcriptional regulator [Candidatus Brocadiae bacterium]|nr:Rrf2 family transcriptional regulator [Candidatus Brocadiia bacterium]
MQLSRAVEYGVRAMQYLATREGICHGDEISKRMGIPDSFLRKILQRLVSAALIRSHRGFAGGFSLARSADDISLLQILEAVDGEFTLNPCLKSTVSEDASCVLDHNCTLQRAFASAQNAMKQTLAGYSLRSLVGVEVPTAIP